VSNERTDRWPLCIISDRFFQAFINEEESLIAIISNFLLYTYALMSTDTEESFIPIPDSETTTALITATERSFEIIIPLSAAK
jgi:hypothetical protein